ncbi:MAG: hypothetical protein LBQ88_13480 [Treponema sp.]|nr:hypothetical protein [Treponema sp.]
MSDAIEAYRKDWAAFHNNQRLSLGGKYGRKLRWREETYKPEKYLRPEPRLRATLELGMGGILVDGVEDIYRLCEKRENTVLS